MRVETDVASVANKVPIYYPKDGSDPKTIIRHTDAAMSRAKEAGRNGYQSFAPEMTGRASERVALENALRQAPEEGGLRLHYQP